MAMLPSALDGLVQRPKAMTAFVSLVAASSSSSGVPVGRRCLVLRPPRRALEASPHPPPAADRRPSAVSFSDSRRSLHAAVRRRAFASQPPLRPASEDDDRGAAAHSSGSADGRRLSSPPSTALPHDPPSSARTAQSTGGRPSVTSTPRGWSPGLVGLVGLSGATAAYFAFRSPSPAAADSLSSEASSEAFYNPPSASAQSSSPPLPAVPRSLIRRMLLDPLNAYVLEPLLTALRFLHLVSLFLPVLVLSPIVLVGPREPPTGEGGKDRGERKTAIWWYKLLVGAMQAAGPSFIKLAQWAGSRTDLFPPALCTQFGQLHSNGKPHAFAHTRAVVERAFGRPFDEVFESFDVEPIGCGAIAQVYKAVLQPDILPPAYRAPKAHPAPGPTGGVVDPTSRRAPEVPTTAVALKVLHPNVHTTVARDLKIMGFFASALNLLPGMVWLSLPEEVGVFGEMMNQQLDLRIESANLTRFEANFAHRRGAAVSFPRPVPDFGTRDLLVEEFENGCPLKWFLRNGGDAYDAQLANMGLDAFLKMLLLDNFTHGDLHPGNIMVKFYRPTTGTLLKSAYDYLLHNLSSSSPSSSSPEAAEESDDVVARLLAVKHDRVAWRSTLGELYSKGYRPELVFIDAGLVTCLDETNRRNFLDLFQAIAEFDGYRAGKLMVERCRTPELVIEPEHFALKIQHIVLSVKATAFTLSAVRISDVLTEVLKGVQASHVKMEGDFVNTILSILLLEGIGRQLDPALDLFKSALPILRQVGGRMGTKEAIAAVPGNDLGAMLKIWLYLEARQLASNVKVDWDTWIKYDRLTPNV